MCSQNQMTAIYIMHKNMQNKVKPLEPVDSIYICTLYFLANRIQTRPRLSQGICLLPSDDFNKQNILDNKMEAVKLKEKKLIKIRKIILYHNGLS